MASFVFGYGSLALLRDTPIEHRLEGFARTWSVAMDNRADLPGYKYYVDPATGDRPEVCVAFLDLRAQAGAAVNGVLLEVSPEDLATFDLRERSYERIAVPGAVFPEPAGEVHVYVGTPAARQRCADGLARGACVVEATYLEAVHDGFRALGNGALGRFEASTDAVPCPVLPLERCDL